MYEILNQVSSPYLALQKFYLFKLYFKICLFTVAYGETRLEIESQLGRGNPGAICEMPGN